MVLYRLLQILILPLQIGQAIWYVLTGQERTSDLRDRLFGFRVSGPAVWFHGASVGELTSARHVIQFLGDNRPDLRIVVTTNRITARDRVLSWGRDGVSAHLAPIDLSWVTRRLLRRTKVEALIVLENELWPARLAACHAAGVPVVLLGARLSAKSARVWSRFPGVARATLAPVALALPQNEETGRYLTSLGVREEVIGPVTMLKASYQPDPAGDRPALEGWSRATTVLAASTHDGEDQIILDAFAAATRHRPELRLIIAPRHIERASEIRDAAASRGLSIAQRSKGEAPDAQVYLADTMGEMSLWYQTAGLCFVGGSLVQKGGHTPYEPIAHGCPVVHGPHVSNFAQDFARLDAAGGTVTVKDAETLTAAILSHLDDRQMAGRAQQIVAPPDTDAITRRILAVLDSGAQSAGQG